MAPHPTAAKSSTILAPTGAVPPTVGPCILDAALSHREGQDGETDRGDKSFSCGHPVWGLAFGPRPPKSAGVAQTAKKTPKGKNSLLLATGLENGVIKIWNVLTGEDRTDGVIVLMLR